MIALIACGFVSYFLSPAAHAYRIMLSPGAASNTTEATNKTLWPYAAANADGAKYGGTWSNNVYTPKTDRQKIVANFTSTLSMAEEVYYNGKVDGNGNLIPPTWVTNRTLPSNFTGTTEVGGAVQYINIYNANGVSWNTPAELAGVKTIFDENGVPSSGINFGTIIRNVGNGYQTFLQPYGHFLFEIRTDTVIESTNLQNAVIESTTWGLDNGKEVFLQILPNNGTRDYERDMRAIMQILYTRLGATRFQNPNLWLSLASYDGSEYDTRLAPQTFNGENHHNTLAGVAKTLLEKRTVYHSGDFSYPRSEYTVQAEAASTQPSFAPWETVTESGTTYVLWPGTGLTNSGNPSTASGIARYGFEVLQAANVALDARVNFANDTSDSFWYRIDDGPWIVEKGNSGNGLKWIGLGRFNLAAGTHTLEIARRRGNSKIDQFRLASATATLSAPLPAPPVTAAAGKNQTVYDYDANGSEPVTLDGSGSTTLSGTITSYVWKEGVTQIATGVLPSVNLTVGTHNLTLTITNSSSQTATGNVSVVVKSNDSLVVVENSAQSVVDTSAYGETHYISNFRVGDGPNRKLVVTVGAGNIGTLGIKYGGKSLTLAKAQDNSTTHASIWYLDNPPVGVADIVQTGGAARGGSLGVLSLQNAAPGFAYSTGANTRDITYTTPLPKMLVVGAYTDNLENAGPSSPLTNKFVTSGGWGGSALGGWQQIASAGTRTDKYRVSSGRVAISTVGFIAAAPKAIQAESAVGQANLTPFTQQTDPDGTSYLVVPNTTGDVNTGSVTNLTGLAAYNFSLTSPADVAVEARVFFASSSDDSFWHRIDGGTWTKQEGPVAAGWKWITLTTYQALATGSHTFEIVRREDGAKIDQIRFSPSVGTLAFVAPPTVYQTYGNGGIPGTGNPWPISDTLPTRIQAENYDQGVEGTTYSDTTAGNQLGGYRSDGVDIQATTDTSGGFNVANVINGEWLQYTVNVAKSTSYTLNLRVARQTAGTGKIRVRFNGVDKTGDLIVPNTTNWQNFVDLPITVKLDAGQQVMRVEMLSSNINLNWIELTPLILPNPWQQTDIGTVGIEGDAIYDTGTFTVSGSGGDISGQGDRFHFVYLPVSGNCEIIARVAAMDNTNAGAKAGVMIRDTLNSDSRHFSTFITPSQGIIFSRRLNTGGFPATTTAAGLTAPYWLKISRYGSLFKSSYSPDGITWTVLGSQGFAISSTVYIGLAVTSKNDAVLCNATFDNVSIPTPIANAGADLTVTDTDANGSETVTLDGSASTAGTGTITSYVWKQGTTQIATGLNPSVNLAIGEHPLTLTITTSVSATNTTSVTITVNPAAPEVVTAINAGGLAYDGNDGISYLASNGFTGATDSSTTTDITNTSDVALYETSVYGTFTWTRSLPNGSYTLILKFSENWASATSSGQRVFSVDVEGNRRVTDLDLFVSAPGQYNAYDVTLPVTITDGQLNVAFTPTANNAVLNAHVLLSVPYPDTNTNGLPDTWEMEYFGNLTKTATGDEDGDGQTNITEFTTGTNPSNSQSAFRIKSATRDSVTSFTVRWDSVSGRTYRVMKSTTLTGGWLPASDPISGTGSEIPFTDPFATDPKSFYEIQVSLP